MRIDRNDIAGAGDIRSAAAEAQKHGKTEPRIERETAPIGDTVQTSQVAALAAGDAMKVERLREAVRAGTYSVDPKEVAASIVQEHLREKE